MDGTQIGSPNTCEKSAVPVTVQPEVPAEPSVLAAVGLPQTELVEVRAPL